MHDDDLRAQLAAYTEHDPDAPPVGELMARADGRRRRRSAGVLGAVAVVAAAAIVVPPLLRSPSVAGPSPVATATPLPTIVATPSPRVPPSPTPRPIYTPTASCAEVRSAWTKAFTGTRPRTPGLPRDAAVLRQSGDMALVARGGVDDVEYRLYAHGLEGPFVELPKTRGEPRHWSSPGVFDGRMVLVESLGYNTSYAIHVVEPGSTERRRVAEGAFEVDRGGLGTPIVRGSVLQWAIYEMAGPDGPADVTVWELDLTRSSAEPVVVKRMHALEGEFGFRFRESRTHFYYDEGDGWVGVDRDSLVEFPAFGVEYEGDASTRGSWGTIFVEERHERGGTELYAVDVSTGAARVILDRGAARVSMAGDLVLVRDFRDLQHVIDLKTDNVIELPGLDARPHYYLTDEVVGRSSDAERGDRGNSVPLESLPTVFPKC